MALSLERNDDCPAKDDVVMAATGPFVALERESAVG